MLKFISFLNHKSHEELAREKYREELALHEKEEREFLTDISGINPDNAVLIGKYLGKTEQHPIYIHKNDLYRHTLVQGGTGAGKSYLALSILLGNPDNFGVLDLKGEFFDLIVLHLGAKLYGKPDREIEEAVKNVIVINPFSDKYLTPLNIITPLPYLPIESLASEIANTFAFVSARFSDRMKKILRMIIQVLAVNKLSLLDVEEFLNNDAFRRMCLQNINDVDVLRFFEYSYDKEPEPTKSALISRLDEFFILQNIKLMFGAGSTVDFREAMKDKIILVNLGKGPFNSGDLTTFFGNFMIKFIGNATFSRTDRNKFMWYFDEWQNLFSSQDMLERLLTESRSFSTFFTFINQGLEQLDSKLRKILLNNIGYLYLFRSARESADHFTHVLPASDTGKEEEQKRIAREIIPKLPDRHFFFWNNRKQYSAQLCKSILLEPPHKKLGITEEKLWDFIDQCGLLKGALGKSISELKQEQEGRRKKIVDYSTCSGPGAKPRKTL